MRSAVLSDELSEESVLRRILAVAVRAMVRSRREVMVLSRAASSSGVMAREGSWGRQWVSVGGEGREVYLDGVVDDLLA
jgi:hypothetical protein